MIMFRRYFEYVMQWLTAGGVRILDALPGVLAAAAIIIVTLLVGKVIKSLITKLLRAIGLNVFTRRAGVDRFLKPTEIAEGVSELIGILVYWLLLFLGITYALSLVGFGTAERLLANFVLHLPKVFVSIVIFVIGVHVAVFVGDLAGKAARGAGIAYAGAIATIVKLVVLLIAVISIVEELAVSLDFLRIVIYMVLGCAVIVVSIVFGVGGIRLGRELLAGTVVRKTLRPGDRMLWNGVVTTVESILPVFTVVRIDDRVLHLPHSALLREITIVK
ncbi:MAG: hypothetical protein EA426_11470 [Spirochaetaceae bacterium]|nr:MAG: hypothetical protein EA426_11470 [Spirochaetaceae bacterium]